ncbi:hypothetical protein DYB32_001192 [Aphanomyces invadans]|uniref:Tc1-like transposase DDE domain-containing protein n=1 Tax=Aphanomyces invadans TaxID=157072 RepID=A0A418B7H8_9STRA|nr:hypothetical protein DYB32_001192 [Aphanomyces invadans]
MVQKFVRDRRATHTRTTAVDVMVYLRELFVLDFNITNKTHEASTLRAVQRFLHRLGYKRGKKKGCTSYHLSTKNALLRDEYVRRMQSHAVSTMPPPVVYMDGSFIHHHYKSQNDSLYDPNDALDNATKEKHKGKRYCYIAGILGSATMDSKLLGLDIFTGGKARGKETKDYRKRLQDECVRFGIGFDVSDYKSILWEKLSQYIHKHIDPVVVDMAKKRGHTVVFTPPHHSDLQPIELVWAIVKGEVGRRYDNETKFADVKKRINAAFAALTTGAMKGCVKVVQEKLKLLHEYLVQVDAMNVDEESSAESDTDGDAEDTCDSLNR